MEVVIRGGDLVRPIICLIAFLSQFSSHTPVAVVGLPLSVVVDPLVQVSRVFGHVLAHLFMFVCFCEVEADALIKGAMTAAIRSIFPIHHNTRRLKQSLNTTQYEQIHI